MSESSCNTGPQVDCQNRSFFILNDQMITRCFLKWSQTPNPPIFPPQISYKLLGMVAVNLGGTRNWNGLEVGGCGCRSTAWGLCRTANHCCKLCNPWVMAIGVVDSHPWCVKDTQIWVCGKIRYTKIQWFIMDRKFLRFFHHFQTHPYVRRWMTMIHMQKKTPRYKQRTWQIVDAKKHRFSKTLLVNYTIQKLNGKNIRSRSRIRMFPKKGVPLNHTFS